MSYDAQLLGKLLMPDLSSATAARAALAKVYFAKTGTGRVLAIRESFSAPPSHYEACTDALREVAALAVAGRVTGSFDEDDDELIEAPPPEELLLREGGSPLRSYARAERSSRGKPAPAGRSVDEVRPASDAALVSEIERRFPGGVAFAPAHEKEFAAFARAERLRLAQRLAHRVGATAPEAKLIGGHCRRSTCALGVGAFDRAALEDLARGGHAVEAWAALLDAVGSAKGAGGTRVVVWFALEHHQGRAQERSRVRSAGSELLLARSDRPRRAPRAPRRAPSASR